MVEPFNFALYTGLGLHLAVFVNSSYLDPYCKMGSIMTNGSYLPMDNMQPAAQSKTAIAFVSEYFEWVSHLSILIHSIIASSIVLSIDG